MNSGRVRPMNVVLGFLVVGRIAVGGFAIVPGISERRRVEKMREVLDIGCMFGVWCLQLASACHC